MFEPNQELGQRIVDATRGTQTGVIIACAFDLERDAIPRFNSKAVITSDGFVQANFIDSSGIGRHCAFIGSYSGLEHNLRALKAHMDLTDDEYQHLIDAIKAWVAVDYR